MIENIKAGERMTQAVLLRLQKVGNSSNGGVFARGTIEDNSGKIQFIAFDREIVNRLRDLDAAKAFMISGPVDIVKYSSTLALQVVIQKLDNIMPEDDISNLVPTGSFDMEVYKNKLEALINGVFAEITATGVKKITAAKDAPMRVEEKTELWGLPAVVLNVTGVGTDEVYFVENEWDINDSQEYDETDYTLPTGKYVRMKRLVPGEQVIMSVDGTLYAALSVGDTVKPASGGTVAKQSN
jgi:hypothetical protein